MDLVLTPIEQRVLGSLLEKQRLVPGSYPLTIKALVASCNQTSSRDPAMQLEDADVEPALESLKAHKLVRRILPSHGDRTTKYRQVADEVLALDDAQRAVLTVLLLRGPQTPQELKTRSERLHPFADAAEVEETLTDMAGWGDPLVRLLPRRSGQRDARWAQLLGGEPVEPETPARSSRSATRAEPAAPLAPPPDPELHGPLVPLVGTWVGTGEGGYPTIAAFAYDERIEIVAVPGKPRLSYRCATRAVDDGRGLHDETGFFRAAADGGVEMVVATGGGAVEANSGVVEVTPTGLVVELASDAVAATPTAKSVTATERSYRVDGDTLTYEVRMAAVGEPLAHHLRATLTRQP